MINLANEWNVPNSGSDISCWNCGAHDNRLPKCMVTKNQDRTDSNKNKREEDNTNKATGVGNYERRQFGRGNGLNCCNNNGGTNVDESGVALSRVA